MFSKDIKIYFDYVRLSGETAIWVKIANINFGHICMKKAPNVDENMHITFVIYKGAGAKCNHQRIRVRARVRANLDLDVRGACVRRKKRSQLTPCWIGEWHSLWINIWGQLKLKSE